MKANSWQVTPEKVDAAIARILEVARPRKLILFGSYVRGQSNQSSDLDILAVTGKRKRRQLKKVRRR